MPASRQSRHKCHPARWALLGVLACATAGAQVPPVAYDGSLRTETRLDRRADGERTLRLARSLRVGARTFLWQPWFATASTRLDLSQVETSAQTDSTSEVVSGEGRLLLFPRSHFPLEAYVSVADSRTELADTLNDPGSFRRTRAGLVQRYRDRSFGASYTAAYEHLVEEEDDGRLVSDQLRLQMNRQVEVHDFNASADVEKRRQTHSGEQVLDGVFVARHGYRPDERSSVESSATLVSLDRESPFGRTLQRTALVNSSASWRPEESTLRVNGNARAFTSMLEAGGLQTLTLQGGASLSASYDISEALRASGSLGASVTGGDAAAITTTTQTATLSYSPDVIDLAGYAYNRFATVSASNRTETGAGTTPGAGATVGHGLNRAVPLSEDGAWLLAGSLGETFSSSVVARGGTTHSVNHNASAALSRSRGTATSTLRLTASDSRIFGVERSALQTLALQATHTASVGRHVSWQGNFTSQLVRIEDTGGASVRPVSSASLGYRHGFLFGVRRLRYSSELSASASELQPFAGGGAESGRRLTWDNRLEYSIGRVEVRLRGSVTHRNGKQDMSVFLSVSRGFDGVF